MQSNWFEDPDDLEALKQAADILYNLDQIHFGVPPHSKDGKPRCVIIAESDLAWWEELRAYRVRSCSDVGTCADLRCRRRKHCGKVDRLTLRVEQARARLAALQATWLARNPTPEPPGACEKGRTEVRP